ncbi:MAG: hypothetical protein ACLPND_05050 [Candidatus Korobacteraceae bacterium]|jgi:hypothetical protein
MRQVAESIEIADALAGVDVPQQELTRLLGYPRGFELEGRARELADWTRNWYAHHGRPWFYARQVESLEFESGAAAGETIRPDLIKIDGVVFNSKRLHTAFKQAGAHSAILVAVGAGPEAEEEARRLWREEKPDEYFFLEMYASAVVEQLTTIAGARLCDWAEQRGMAVLPHSSPGYPDWDVAEQPRLLKLIRHTRSEQFPSRVDAFDSGMLRPKKTQLAVFGVTRHTERLQRLTSLIPCESCSFGPCQYRRAPYKRAPRTTAEPLPAPTPVLDADAQYTVNRKALQRWAEERLAIAPQPDGSIEASFRYDGTTCTNMGRPLAFIYKVKLGPRADEYPILDERCSPAEDDTGHESMCKFVEDPDRLMNAIDGERPLLGQRLNAVLEWRREPNGAGCYCEPQSRSHKWGLVLETIHYALVQKELSGETENP